MNKTQNSNLKLALENLKCNPSESLRELWAKTAEAEKSTGQIFEDEASQVQNGDYEYYDETQLNGKLFYIDVRELANCVKGAPKVVPPANNEKSSISAETTTVTSTKATTSSQTTKIPVTTEFKLTRTTTVMPVEHKSIVYEQNTNNESNKDKSKNKDSFTTVRQVTASAKPLENNNKLFEQDMASDEARPERIKAHRSVQDAPGGRAARADPTDATYRANSAHANIGNLLLLALTLCYRLCF